MRARTKRREGLSPGELELEQLQRQEEQAQLMHSPSSSMPMTLQTRRLPLPLPTPPARLARVSAARLLRPASATHARERVSSGESARASS